MSGFPTDFKLGPVGAEIVILGNDPVDNLSGFAVLSGNSQASTINVVDEERTVLHRRFQRAITIVAEEISESLMWSFDSLNSRLDQELSFLYADGWWVYSEPYYTDGLTHLTMKTNSHLLLHKALKAGGHAQDAIGISGVWLREDMRGLQAEPGETNFYKTGSGASYDPATFGVTLSSSPGPIGTLVYVNWLYNGALVKIIPPGIQIEWTGFFHPTTGEPTFTIGFQVRGI
jgi:hypothetical protein